MHADTTRRGGTIVAALPLTPAIVRVLEGGPWHYTWDHATTRTRVVPVDYATRGWHTVCDSGDTEAITPATTVPTRTAQAVRRVVPVEVALARGLLARKLQVIGAIGAVVKPRVTED